MDVCYHSGQPRDSCDYHCEYCWHDYSPAPDPAEIQQRSREVRATWGRERISKQRCDLVRVPWEVPVVAVDECFRALLDSLDKELLL